jgi:hypothetical protein
VAQSRRGVWIEADRDGMGWLNAYLPSDKLAMIGAALDGAAFGLFTETGETRTMTQLRADVLTDLLTDLLTGTGTGQRSRVGVTVALTVPMLGLLGHTTTRRSSRASARSTSTPPAGCAPTHPR